MIAKIHGCVWHYREFRETGEWERYLPSMVFTFREVQNWRGDSWSRDLLATLMRTRTVVFLGYSVADAVLHNTFRDVYEEMRQRRGRDAVSLGRLQSPFAQAFFFGPADRLEFHGLEVLRAASRAAGDENPYLTSHPNYLGFEWKDSGQFPDVDELLLWLLHRVVRMRQQEVLRSCLRRVATMVFKGPRPPREVDAICAAFKALCDAECALAAGGDSQPPFDRSALARIVRWTTAFHAEMLREFASAEGIMLRDTPGLFELSRLRHEPWYRAVADSPEWAACGVLIEVALRRMIAVWREEIDWTKDSAWVSAQSAWPPTVLFAYGKRTDAGSREPQPQPGAQGDQRTRAPKRFNAVPTAVSIRVRAVERVGQVPPALGVVRKQVVWELDPRALPRTAAHGRTPSIETLWDWAAGTPSAQDQNSLSSYLGVDDI